MREPNLTAPDHHVRIRSPQASPLAIKLVVSHPQLTMANRAAFVVAVEVTNRGTTPVDPQLATTCELSVNGYTSVAWNFAVNDNQGRDHKWSQLPPGETVSLSRAYGVWLFPKPGNYRLVLTIGGQQAVAIVDVTP